MMELRQSPEWGKYLASWGWQTEVVDACAVRIKKLGPLGSIIKIQRPENLPLEKFEEAAKRQRGLFVKIEPTNESQISELRTHNYQLDNWPLTPPRTVMIDLTLGEEELLKSFSKDTRQTIKRTRNQELGIRSLDFGEIDAGKEVALKQFHRIWRETGRRNHFFVQPYRELLNKVQAFGPRAVLILAQTDQVPGNPKSKNRPGRPPYQHPTPRFAVASARRAEVGPDNEAAEIGKSALAGCLLLFYDKTAYYHHAASTREGLELEAPYAVMWQAFLESKKRGMKKLDLEGIFDPRFPSMFKKWLGFSTFKLKWGGQILEYPGAYIKIRNPLIKLLFSLEKIFPKLS